MTSIPAKILLVEDSPTDRLMALEALESAGLLDRLQVVENGEEAMAYLRREGQYRDAARPALILLDLNMPKKDGREVLAEIKSDPLLMSIPVIILTTSSAEEDVLRAYGDHANSFITKPVNFARFSEAIAVLGRYWLEFVTLPPDSAAPLVRPPQQAVSEDAGQRSFQVLLVEDNPVDVLFLEDALASSALGHFRVQKIGRIAELAKMVETHRFDVVITDLGLPDSQGLTTFRRIRATVPDLPIIVLTGDRDEQIGIESLHEGAQDYLVKGELSGGAVARAIRYAVDKRRIEDQLRQSQRMETVGRLAGGIAHDFNNLLTVIQGHASQLCYESLDASESAESSRAILEATERAAALTRQLLTFSHRQSVSLKLLDLNQVVRSFSKVLKRVLGAPVDLQLDLDENPLTLGGDTGMLEQILMNLAVNARDAMPSGGTLLFKTSEIELERAEAEQSGDSRKFARLEVSDTGTGMDERALSRLFEPFFTTKEPGSGTGLGLATVHSIVKQHGGHIAVTSKPGSGARFEVLLPLRDGQPEISDGVPQASTIVSHKSHPLAGTILLAEDEDSVRALAVRSLQRAGFRVLAAGSGAEALSVFANSGETIDLLLTDLIMPGGMTGRQLAEELKKSRPELPIIYCSGYSDDFVSPELPLEEGANFIQKPFSPAALLQVVRARLGHAPP